MSLIKYFQKFLSSQKGDNELLQFHLLSNHSLAPLLDLLTAECIRYTKVDHLPNYPHLLRMFEGTKADLQPN